MKVFRLSTAIGFVLSAALLPARAQSPKPKPAFFIQLVPASQKLLIGTRVTVKALITSTSDLFDTSARGAMIGCSGVDSVHVEMEDGREPEMTELHRRFLTGGGSCFSQELTVGGTLPKTYDLSAFYQLRTPGKYTVWVEVGDNVRDPNTGNVITIPVRSNTAHFELAPSK